MLTGLTRVSTCSFPVTLDPVLLLAVGNFDEIQVSVIRYSKGHKPRSKHMDSNIVFVPLRFVKYLKMKKLINMRFTFITINLKEKAQGSREPKS